MWLIHDGSGSRAADIGSGAAGGTLTIDGTTAVVLLAPIEVTIMEVDAEAVVEKKSMAMPVSAIVVEALQDPIADADRPAILAGAWPW